MFYDEPEESFLDIEKGEEKNWMAPETYADAKVITPVPELMEAIAKFLSFRLRSVFKNGMFIGGYASQFDMVCSKVDDSTYDVFIESLDFEFNGRERKLLNLPFKMIIEMVGDNQFRFKGLEVLNNWRQYANSRENAMKCVLPDSKSALGKTITKCLSNEAIHKILDMATEMLMVLFPNGEFSIKDADSKNKLKKLDMLDKEGDDSEVESDTSIEDDDDTLFEGRMRLSESDIRYITRKVKSIIREGLY